MLKRLSREVQNAEVLDFGLGMTIHFLETVADEFKEPDLAARIPAGHRFEVSTAQESRRSSRITFKEGDKPELTGCPIRRTTLA
jgi:hypothetical protein